MSVSEDNALLAGLIGMFVIYVGLRIALGKRGHAVQHQALFLEVLTIGAAGLVLVSSVFPPAFSMVSENKIIIIFVSMSALLNGLSAISKWFDTTSETERR